MDYNERAQKIVKLRDEQHETFAFIGTQFGITAVRVRQIYLASKSVSSWDDGLPNRVKHILHNAGITTREKAIEMVKSKEILRHRNMGWQSFQILCVWLGLGMPRRGKPKTCPHCGKEIWLKWQ